ncbi:MAG: VTT domain-containing protein [Planctomycetota bacterium]
MTAPMPEPAAPTAASPWPKIAAAAAVAAVAGALLYFFGEYLSFEALARSEESLLAFGRANLLAFVVVAYLIYAAVTGLSLPGALVLTVGYGWLFAALRPGWEGVAIGVAVVSFASTTGATIAFLISRYFLRDTIATRFPERVEKFDAAVRDEGPFFLFSLRLLPVVPFFVLNAAMGLTPIGVGTFWWVSQLGMLPGTAVYTYAGSQVPTLADLAENGIGSVLTPQLWVALVLLAVFPFVVKFAFKKFAPARPTGDA